MRYDEPGFRVDHHSNRRGDDHADPAGKRRDANGDPSDTPPTPTRAPATNSFARLPTSTPTATRTRTRPLLVLNAPTALVASAVSSNRIQLTWTDRSTNNSTLMTITATAPNPASSINTGLSTNVTYYRVRAVNGSVGSSFSNTAYAKARRWTRAGEASAFTDG